MGFYARPDLSDVQFKQSSGSTLTLEGKTKIATLNGLSLAVGDNANTYRIITASGGTTGNVLTLGVDNIIRLMPSGDGSSGEFNTNRVTTRALIPPVTVGGENTIQHFLEGYFFPPVPPSASISIPIGRTNREFGDAGEGSLSWSVTKNTNSISEIKLSTNGGSLYNETVSHTGNSQSGTTPYTILSGASSPATPDELSKTRIYRISTRTTTSQPVISEVTITWSYRKFDFKSNTQYTSSAIISKMGEIVGDLSTTIALSKSLTFNDEFFYYVYPVSFGLPVVTVNGLLNNGWGNPNNGTLITITYVNSHSFSSLYYVIRSDNRMTGTYSISISKKI